MDKKDIQINQSKLQNLDNGTNNIQEIPTFLSYFNALDPRVFNPIAFQRGGMSKISFYSYDESNDVNIYRIIALYDECIGIQDEIHLNHENQGIQFNFKLNLKGEFIPDSVKFDFLAYMGKYLDAILRMVQQRGSILMSDNGYYAVSDGESWVQLTREQRDELSDSQIKLK